jgi:hypothetical protein
MSRFRNTSASFVRRSDSIVWTKQVNTLRIIFCWRFLYSFQTISTNVQDDHICITDQCIEPTRNIVFRHEIFAKDRKIHPMPAYMLKSNQSKWESSTLYFFVQSSFCMCRICSGEIDKCFNKLRDMKAWQNLIVLFHVINILTVLCISVYILLYDPTCTGKQNNFCLILETCGNDFFPYFPVPFPAGIGNGNSRWDFGNGNTGTGTTWTKWRSRDCSNSFLYIYQSLFI